MKKLLAGFLALITCTVIGCGGSEVTKEKAVVKEKTEKVLTIGAGRTFWYGPTKMNYMHKSTNVWESLVTLDENMNPVPDLAKEIGVSEDGLTWKIVLHEGIKFHDGSELTAEVAKANLKRVYHFSSKEKKCVKDYKNIVSMGEIEEIKVNSDYELEVKHKKPIPDFDARLAYYNGEMFSMASFNEDGQVVKPIGTGVVKFDSYDEKTEVLTLTKFDEYRNGAANVDKVIFKSIPDADTRLSALRSGEIDAIADVGSILPAQAQIIEGDSNLELQDQAVGTNHYIFMNMSEGNTFSNPVVREALSLLVDRKLILETILEGHGTAAGSVVTNNSKKFFSNVGYEHNSEKAKELIDKNSSSIEKPVKILLSSSLIGRWPYKDVMVLLQGELKKVGIESEIEIVDAPTWSEKMSKGEYDLTMGPDTVSTAEPLEFFNRHMAKDGDTNVSRMYGYENKRVDELLSLVANETNEAKRVEYYKELQEIAKTEGPMIPVWHDSALFATNKKVKNFTLDLNFWPDLHKVVIEE